MTGKGTYTFKWTEEATEVYVTGTFDDWKKTEKLEKAPDGTHIASVELPIEKTLYKYVIDGDKWVIDPTQRVEKDAEGNDNNYLLPEDISPKEEPTLSVPVIPDTAEETVTPFVQSTGPTATTAALAAEVPLEPKRDLEAEAAAKAEEAKAEEAKAEEAKVEEAKAEEPKAEEPKVEETKPEEPAVSEEPVVPATISSVGPEATTAALAAEVPLEEKTKEEPIVPEATKVVTAPEDLPTPDPKTVPGYLPDTADDAEEIVSVNPIPASETPGNPIDLAPGDPVPESTGSVTDNVKLDMESYEKADASNLGVGATAAAALAAVTAAVSTAVETVTGKSEEVLEATKDLIPESALPIKSDPEDDKATTTTDTVPPVVTDSQAKADVEPEASANQEAVEAKKEVEDELVSKTEVAAPVPVTTETPHADVPDVVRESQAEASAPLEASASPVAVEAKKEIEAELKSEVKPAEPVPEEPTEKPSEPAAVPAVVTASAEKAGETSEAAANPVAVEAKAATEEAITTGETKVEPLEPPKKEEPSTTKKEEPSTTEKAAETAADTAETVADKAAPESSKPTETTTAAESDAAKKKKRRVSAFFHKIAQKLK